MNTTKYYFSNAKRQIQGPSTLREILTMAQQGEVDAQTALVRPENSPRWMTFLQALQQDVSGSAPTAAPDAEAAAAPRPATPETNMPIPTSPAHPEARQSGNPAFSFHMHSAPAGQPSTAPTTISNTAAKPPRSQINFTAPQLPGNEAPTTQSSGIAPTATGRLAPSSHHSTTAAVPAPKTPPTPAPAPSPAASATPSSSVTPSISTTPSTSCSTTGAAAETPAAQTQQPITPAPPLQASRPAPQLLIAEEDEEQPASAISTAGVNHHRRSRRWLINLGMLCACCGIAAPLAYHYSQPIQAALDSLHQILKQTLPPQLSIYLPESFTCPLLGTEEPQQPTIPSSPVAQLFTAIRLGDMPTLKKLLLTEFLQQKETPQYEDRTPLTLAAELGLEDEAEVLLLYSRGTPELYDSAVGVNAMQLAAYHGHVGVIKLLLRHQCAMQPAGSPFTAMDFATARGQDSIERILTDAGAPAARDLDSSAQLAIAALAYDDTGIKELLAQGTGINTANAEGRTALHQVVAAGHIPAIRLLLANGADVNSTDSRGLTPLHLAAECDRSAAAAILLAKGADLTARDRLGATPLHLASAKGAEATIDVLLAQGAKLNSTNLQGYTPLMLAGTPAIAEMLMDRGADPQAASPKDGRTALHLAVAAGQADTVATLLAKGAEQVPDAEGNTPLHLAARQGDTKLIGLLLERGANLKSLNAQGQSPLHLAAQSDATPAVKQLLLKACDPNARDFAGNTPVHLAAQANHPTNILPLIFKGGDINLTNNQGYTPLMLAATHSATRAIETLLARGARPDAVLPDGSSALHLAAARGDSETIRLLLDKGLAVDAANNRGYTPMLLAAEKGKPEAVQTLLEHGASISSTLNSGFTALHLAAYEGSEQVTQLLLEYGANPTTKNKFGKTALDVARNCGRAELIPLLEKAESQYRLTVDSLLP